MANSKILLSDLKSDNCSSRVQVRLLRFWEAGYVRRGGELMSVHMLLPDSKSVLILLTIVMSISGDLPLILRICSIRDFVSYATIMPATMNASHFSRFMLSPSSPRRLRRDLQRLMGSRLWEGGELLDIILSRGGKYKEEDAKFVMIQIFDCILSSPRCCTPRSQTQDYNERTTNL
ncbi:LOW QUALITY PROTEIN: hypothetical protein HID58_088221 [Brassica napus]|uniref:Uncharacterized protein n=1 Tax=Brassica napus TaxID=3708 RepID=A0ABQ7XVJ9_BRANA|nr:LOW QUALITY PROTEIN: hypothetical protein HID58_088221 [Brassica napus]